MITYDLAHKSSDGKDYYTVYLDRTNGDFFMIKNQSCLASGFDFIALTYKIEYYEAHRRFLDFFNLNDSTPNRERIPKKYHKIIFK